MQNARTAGAEKFMKSVVDAVHPDLYGTVIDTTRDVGNVVQAGEDEMEREHQAAFAIRIGLK